MALYKRGKVWYISYWYKGKRYQHRASESKKEALAMLSAIKTEINWGRIGLTPPDPKRNKAEIAIRYFDELVERFYQDYVVANSRHPKDYKNRLNLLTRFFGGKAISEITPNLIERYKSHRREKGVSAAAINRELAALKRMFNIGARWNVVAENPMRGVSLFHEEVKVFQTLDPTLDADLLKECQYKWVYKLHRYVIPEKPFHLRMIVLLALDTGMRLGEILTLKWSQIDLERKRITLTWTKAKKARVLPMTNRVSEALNVWQQHYSGSEYLFPNKRAKTSIKSVKQSFGSACKRLGIKIRFHDLRHTFATRLLDAGVDIKTVSELLGHSTIAMTSRYVHSSFEAKERAIAKLAGYRTATKSESDDEDE